jgi:hypothetical protein
VPSAAAAPYLNTLAAECRSDKLLKDSNGFHSMIRQRTLNNTIRASGVGMHTGDKVYLTLHPAEPDTGIVFVRTDLDPCVEIPAQAKNVGDTMLSTTLLNGNVRVSTVEHLLSALAGLGIDNARVDVSAAEIPIMDGSAAPFVFFNAVRRYPRAGRCEEVCPCEKNGDRRARG